MEESNIFNPIPKDASKTDGEFGDFLETVPLPEQHHYVCIDPHRPTNFSFPVSSSHTTVSIISDPDSHTNYWTSIEDFLMEFSGLIFRSVICSLIVKKVILG